MAFAEEGHARATGGCLCGAIRYAVRGPLRGIPLRPRADVALESTDTLRWFANSGRGRRGFRAGCGSSLFFEARGEHRLAIAAGSRDQPSGLETVGHEYVADKADYVRIDDDLPAWAGDWKQS